METEKPIAPMLPPSRITVSCEVLEIGPVRTVDTDKQYLIFRNVIIKYFTGKRNERATVILPAKYINAFHVGKQYELILTLKGRNDHNGFLHNQLYVHHIKNIDQN